jgi:RNA polymerase sigma-70 factor, ECF subfamily
MEGFLQSGQWRVGPRRSITDRALKPPVTASSDPPKRTAGPQADAPGTTMAQSPSDDLELLRQLAKGSDVAFASLYERYQGPIFRFALHMSGNAASAEEITQEVFMTVISKPRSYDPAKGTVAGYLFGMARNLMRRNMQRTCNDVPFLEESAEEDVREPSDVDLLESLSQAESLECLRKAVLALPEPYREVVVLCELEEMTYPEVAAVLRCSPGTIASRLNRAKSILKTKLEGQGHMKRCVG